MSIYWLGFAISNFNLTAYQRRRIKVTLPELRSKLIWNGAYRFFTNPTYYSGTCAFGIDLKETNINFPEYDIDEEERGINNPSIQSFNFSKLGSLYFFTLTQFYGVDNGITQGFKTPIIFNSNRLLFFAQNKTGSELTGINFALILAFEDDVSTHSDVSFKQDKDASSKIKRLAIQPIIEDTIEL